MLTVLVFHFSNKRLFIYRYWKVFFPMKSHEIVMCYTVAKCSTYIHMKRSLHLWAAHNVLHNCCSQHFDEMNSAWIHSARHCGVCLKDFVVTFAAFDLLVRGRQRRCYYTIYFCLENIFSRRELTKFTLFPFVCIYYTHLSVRYL